jgi:hypothetical protein
VRSRARCQTFVAMRLMLQRMQSGERVLFLARSEALALYVAKWLCWHGVSEGRPTPATFATWTELLAQFEAVFDPIEEGPRSCHVDDESRRIFFKAARMSQPSASAAPSPPTSATPTPPASALPPTPPSAFPYKFLVMDEAHHVLTRLEWKEELRQRSFGVACLLLSDISQGELECEFPWDATVLRVAEVVRATQRLTLATADFAVPGILEASPHHSFEGPPPKAFFFKASRPSQRVRLYAERIVDAVRYVQSIVPRLSLDNRVAIVVPNDAFAAKVRTHLVQALEAMSAATPSHPGFELIDAKESSALMVGRDEGPERLLFDRIDECDGLERLFVVAAGLQEDLRTPKATRSRLYRAFSRAQVIGCVVNEDLGGGEGDMLAWLTQCKLQQGRFDRDAELRSRDREHAMARVYSQASRAGSREARSRYCCCWGVAAEDDDDANGIGEAGERGLAGRSATRVLDSPAAPMLAAVQCGGHAINVTGHAEDRGYDGDRTVGPSAAPAPAAMEREADSAPSHKRPETPSHDGGLLRLVCCCFASESPPPASLREQTLWDVDAHAGHDHSEGGYLPFHREGETAKEAKERERAEARAAKRAKAARRVKNFKGPCAACCKPLAPCFCVTADGEYTCCCVPTEYKYILPCCAHMCLCPHRGCDAHGEESGSASNLFCVAFQDPYQCFQDWFPGFVSSVCCLACLHDLSRTWYPRRESNPQSSP